MFWKKLFRFKFGMFLRFSTSKGKIEFLQSRFVVRLSVKTIFSLERLKVWSWNQIIIPMVPFLCRNFQRLISYKKMLRPEKTFLEILIMQNNVINRNIIIIQRLLDLFHYMCYRTFLLSKFQSSRSTGSKLSVVKAIGYCRLKNGTKKDLLRDF